MTFRILVLVLFTFSCVKIPRVTLLKKRPGHDPGFIAKAYQCRELPNAYLGESDHYSYFNKMLNRLKNLNISLNTYEIFSLWAFSQLNLRPDQISLFSDLKFLILTKNTERFYWTTQLGKQPSISFFKMIETVLSRSSTSRSLDKLIFIFDKYYPRYIAVGAKFSQFLYNNISYFSSHTKPFSHFFRGDDIIKKGELVKKFPLPSYLGEYYRTQSKVKLNQKGIKKSESLFCSDGAEKYLSGYTNPTSHFQESYSFGYRSSSTVILVNSSIKIDKLAKRIRKGILPGVMNANTTPYCRFSGPKYNLWLSSTQSQDPAQILAQLHGYNIHKTNDINKVFQFIDFSRHLILQNPTRILYESQRGSEEQLEKLNMLSVPIYHSKEISEVSGVISENGKKRNFLLDDRSDIRENCDSPQKKVEL